MNKKHIDVLKDLKAEAEKFSTHPQEVKDALGAGIEALKAGGVKHGSWSNQMLFDDGFGGARAGYICSACKKYVPFAGNFCGNCGAEMENGRSYDE